MSPAFESSDLEMEWVRLAQAGDRRAYAELVGCYREGVVGMVYRMCGDIHLAEDVAQDTFIRAWQHLPAYQPRTSLRSWLYRIAANRVVDVLRHEKPAGDIDQLDPPETGKSLEANVVQNEQLQAVQTAVLSLPLSSRAVLILREYEGLSYREISQALDIPLGTVMSRLNFARKQLLGKLQAEMENV